MAVNIYWDRKQQKASKMEYDPEKPLGQQLMNSIHRMREEGMYSESKEDYQRRIYAKVQAGKELTADEMSYLARNNPTLYQKALRAQMMRRALEKSLKSCSSKEEAQDVFSIAVGSISEKDPDREIIIAALRDAYKEFTKSKEYGMLPETRKEAEEDGKKSLDFQVNESGYQETYVKEPEQINFMA